MAEKQGINFRKVEKFPASVADAGDYDGNARQQYDEYTMDGSEAANDTIVLGVIRPTERINTFRLKHGALGAGRTLSLGVEGNATLFLAATDVSAAGIQTGPDTDAGFAYKTTASSNKYLKLIATLAGGAGTNGIKIQLQAQFSREGS